MKYADFYRSFEEFVAACPEERMTPGSRYVFLSDLHMGSGGKKDDLEHNRILVQTALAKWYLERDYILVLNGDIEDLSKFKLSHIRSAWSGLYGILDVFARRDQLRRIVGNHDLALLRVKEYPYRLLHGLVLEQDGRRIFAFHGHQASTFFTRHGYLSDFIVRYVAKPLRLRNTGISGDSRRRFKAERRVYKASKRMGILSINGHTHRPLFESLSKYDSLRFAIEDLLGSYESAEQAARRKIVELVDIYRGELERLAGKDRRYSLSRSLYEDGSFLIPCLFNSGCATGGNGFTAIEIEGGSISLVHWTEEGRARAYLERESAMKDELQGSPFARYVIRSDRLEKVFARIELLGR